MMLFYNVKRYLISSKKDDAAKWHGMINEWFCLLEWAKRVGKSTIAEEFAKNNYESYILVDFF